MDVIKYSFINAVFFDTLHFIISILSICAQFEKYFLLKVDSVNIMQITDSNDPIINQIIYSFSKYNLRDIKKIGELADSNLLDFVLAEFTLCTCLIDQLSGFRYNRESVKSRFTDFIDEYLKNYNSKELYEDLRNRIIHNYSVGEVFELTRRKSPQQPIEQPNVKRLYLDVFVLELENAMDKFFNQLKTDRQIRQNSIEWFKKYNVFGSV